MRMDPEDIAGANPPDACPPWVVDDENDCPPRPLRVGVLAVVGLDPFAVAVEVGDDPGGHGRSPMFGSTRICSVASVTCVIGNPRSGTAAGSGAIPYTQGTGGAPTSVAGASPRRRSRDCRGVFVGAGGRGQGFDASRRLPCAGQRCVRAAGRRRVAPRRGRRLPRLGHCSASDPEPPWWGTGRTRDGPPASCCHRPVGSTPGRSAPREPGVSMATAAPLSIRSDTARCLGRAAARSAGPGSATDTAALADSSLLERLVSACSSRQLSARPSWSVR